MSSARNSDLIMVISMIIGILLIIGFIGAFVYGIAALASYIRRKKEDNKEYPDIPIPNKTN
jgi:pilus assembly protein TadC